MSRPRIPHRVYGECPAWTRLFAEPWRADRPPGRLQCSASFPPGRSAQTEILLRLVRTGSGRSAHRTPCRSEEHTSELQSLMRISYAVFCLKKKNLSPSLTFHDHRLYNNMIQSNLIHTITP